MSKNISITHFSVFTTYKINNLTTMCFVAQELSDCVIVQSILTARWNPDRFYAFYLVSRFEFNSIVDYSVSGNARSKVLALCTRMWSNVKCVKLVM